MLQLQSHLGMIDTRHPTHRILSEKQETPMKTTVPVTVLTGFLGAGKTTLLNRILSEQHGKRIAVIENEFGEVGVDQALVIGAEEEIFEMNNGCICCTVRGDLIRILGNLMKRRDKFDHILVETTGLADPGPVAQTFLVDDEIRSQLTLDGIVTVVDARHIWDHIDDSKEAQEQIAFADVIALNKCDLVAPADLDRLEEKIRSINAAARIRRCEQANLPIDAVLNVGGFDIDRALVIDPRFLEAEQPFEWAGAYVLERGRHELTLDSGPDPALSFLLLPIPAASPDAIRSACERAALIFSTEARPGMSDASSPSGPLCMRIEVGPDGANHRIEVPKPGCYALFTEHHPTEFNLRLQHAGATLTAQAQLDFKPNHEHDSNISSVGFHIAGDFDRAKLDAWFGLLLREHGNDLFRMKGVLSLKGEAVRYVFQGVHMLLDVMPSRPWAAEARESRFVFIGRNLDREILDTGFRACLAS